MKKVVLPAFIIVIAILLDGWVDALRADGIKSILLDGAPSLISAIFIPLAYLVYKRFTITSINIGIYYCIGLIIYEFTQLISRSGRFDMIDVGMSFFGLLLILVIKVVLSLKMKNNK